MFFHAVRRRFARTPRHAGNAYAAVVGYNDDDSDAVREYDDDEDERENANPL